MMCFIAWRRIAPSAVMRAIQWSPYIAVGLGIVLQVIGVRALVLLEYTGVPRLTAGLDAAYMGAVAMFGVIASVWLWLRGNSVSLFWALGSLLMTLASGTRGATVVALIVFLAAMLFSGAAGGAKKGIVRVVALVIGLGVILNAVPLLIDRATNSGSAQGLYLGVTPRGVSSGFLCKSVLGSVTASVQTRNSTCSQITPSLQSTSLLLTTLISSSS